jgi:predicted amidophosphoribosyltransferase
MAKFIIEPHFRLQEWVAEEKDYFHLEVDDIVTTGSTLGAVARLLREHGVRSVHAIALAHSEWGGW